MKTVKLGDVCEFRNGLWSGKKPPFVRVGVIRNTNFTKAGTLDDSDIAYLDVEQAQFEKRKLNYGDIILEKSGGGPKQPVGRVIVFDKAHGDYSFSNFTSAISIKNPRELDFRYLHRYLFYIYQDGRTEVMQKHTTGIRNLNFDEYKSIEVPLPSLEEQRRVVERLDAAFEKIDQAIELTEKNLQSIRGYPRYWLEKKYLTLSQNWESKKLNEIATFKGGGTPSKSKPEYWVGELPWVSPKDMKSRRIYDTQDHISEKAVQESSTSKIPKNSVLVVVRSGILAHTIPLAVNSQVVTLNQDMKAIIPGKAIHPEALFMLLMALRDKIFGFVSKGATVHRINSDLLKDMEVRFPKLRSDQVSFANECRKVMDESAGLEELYDKKINHFRALKHSLLTQAFSHGEVE